MAAMTGSLILIGHFDSPAVRRVAVSLQVLGFRFERLPLSIFRDAEELKHYNPLGRVPALVLESGEALIDSGAILDHFDEVVGPERALLPRSGAARRSALGLMALAAGAVEKAMAIAYEDLRSPDKVDAGWVARLRGQLDSGLSALEARVCRLTLEPLAQPAITIATALGYIRYRDALPTGRFAALDRLSANCEATAAFMACLPSLEEIGGDPAHARSALDRLRGKRLGES